MPSFNSAKRMYGNTETIGQQLKQMSDDVMKQTWNNNIQSRVCYFYDYFHDDTPMLNTEIPHGPECQKTKINVKFIITSYGSIDKDQIAYHIQFEPNQKTKFEPNDRLYYYETEFRKKYGATFPIGLFCDIPDDEGIYNRWIVCSKEIGNQFVKYNVLPCDYHLHWVDFVDGKRIKRKMWGTTRDQKSYNQGTWRSYISEIQENQNKIWLPMNSITENLFYVCDNEEIHNQRVIMSAPTKNPITWRITKVENTKPLGLQKLTFAQDKFNSNTDFIDKDEQSTGDIFAMYANYYSSTVIPDDEKKPEMNPGYHCNISCNSNKIKAGGSYKLLTASMFDLSNTDITENWIASFSQNSWKCYINSQDVTDSELITWLPQPEPNKMKIKFANDRSYLTNILTIKCRSNINGFEITGEIQLEITAL